jgi:hypothetical protein
MPEEAIDAIVAMNPEEKQGVYPESPNIDPISCDAQEQISCQRGRISIRKPIFDHDLDDFRPILGAIRRKDLM